MMNNKTVSCLYSKTITNMDMHKQEEPTKTITNKTGSRPMGTTQEQRNKNYEMFGGGVMLVECCTK